MWFGFATSAWASRLGFPSGLRRVAGSAEGLEVVVVVAAAEVAGDDVVDLACGLPAGAASVVVAPQDACSGAGPVGWERGGAAGPGHWVTEPGCGDTAGKVAHGNTLIRRLSGSAR